MARPKHLFVLKVVFVGLLFALNCKSVPDPVLRAAANRIYDYHLSCKIGDRATSYAGEWVDFGSSQVRYELIDERGECVVENSDIQRHIVCLDFRVSRKSDSTVSTETESHVLEVFRSRGLDPSDRSLGPWRVGMLSEYHNDTNAAHRDYEGILMREHRTKVGN